MPSLTTSFRAVFHRHASWVRPLAVLNLLVIGSLLWPSATAAMIFPRQVNVAVNRLLPDSSFSLPARRSPLELTLRVTPAQIELQGIVTYTVIISNTLASDTLTGLEVSDRLPPSLRYVSAEGGVFTYLAAEHRVQWSIESLAAGETLIGAFQAQVVGVNADQPILNTVVASAATGVEVQATAILTMLSLPCLGSACTPTPTASPVTPPCMGSACTPTPTATPSPTPAAATPTWTPTPTALPGLDEVWLTPGEGGVLASDDGRIVVEAPPGAVTQRTLLRYVAQPPVGELPPWLMLPFGLEAQDEQGASVLHFATLVSLTYHFPADIVLTERIGLYR